MTEPFLTRDELATALRVHVDTVDKWRREGMPSERWGKRTRRFQLSRCLNWLRQRHGGSMAA